MKLIHAQIYGAIVSILLVGVMLWGMSTRQALRATSRERQELETKLGEAAKNRPADKGERTAAQTQLEMEVEALRQRVKSLEAERERLARAVREHESLARARIDGERTASVPVLPQPPSGLGSPLADGPPGPPPIAAPPPAPRSEPWGASSDHELDEMARALKLSNEQRDEVRVIIMDSQNEFERRLIEAAQRGDADISLLEKVGEELSKKTEQRIRQMLFPDQQESFREYLRRLEEGGEGR